MSFAALAAGVLAGLAGCGFSETLTRRGFIEEGDSICGQTIVKTAFDLERQGGLAAGPGPYLGQLGEAYAAAGSRFGRLDVRSDDEEMRNRIVTGFERTAVDLRRVAETAAAGGDIQAQAGRVFVRTGSLLDELEAYGFQVCGGRIGQGQQ